MGKRPSLTNDPTALARARLSEIAGSTFVVGPDERNHKSNQNISDAIGAVPGVITQNFFGGNDQVRIQMRDRGYSRIPPNAGYCCFRTVCRSVEPMAHTSFPALNRTRAIRLKCTAAPQAGVSEPPR